MKIFNFKNFMKKYSSKNDNMNEYEIKRIYNFPKYPKDSKVSSDKGFVNKDNGTPGGTHWTCFIMKDNK